MKKTLIAAAFVASLLIFPAVRAEAQSVAILDLSYVFKNHSRFQAMKDNMRQSVEIAESDITNRRNQINELIQSAKDLKSTSAEFKQIDEQVTKLKADLEVQLALQKKRFLGQEADIYYKVYQEILQEVKYYCEQRNITLVLRFNGDPLNERDAETVLKHLNKPVIWHNPHIDITPHILNVLNQRSGPATPNPVGRRDQVPLPNRQ